MLKSNLDILHVLHPPNRTGRPKIFINDADIITYKQAGWSNRTIAVSMNVSRSTINRRVNDLIKKGYINPDDYDYNFSNPSAATQPRRKNKEQWEFWHGKGV